MKRKNSPVEHKADAGRWLLTYSDLMNNLLVLFIMLYAISITDLAKFEALADAFSETFSGNKTTTTTNKPEDMTINIDDLIDHESTTESTEPLTDSMSDVELPPSNITIDDNLQNEFDLLYSQIKKILEEKNLQDVIMVEKANEYIYFRFSEGVLFEPNQPILKKSSYEILSTVGDILNDAYGFITNIDISGHTARDSLTDSTTNFFGWELSADRAITVLRYLVQECNMPQSKMSISGHSHNKPYKVGFKEEIMALNRRVEIRISREVLEGIQSTTN